MKKFHLAVNVLCELFRLIDKKRLSNNKHRKLIDSVSSDLEGLLSDVVTKDGIHGQFGRSEEELQMAFSMIVEKYKL